MGELLVISLGVVAGVLLDIWIERVGKRRAPASPPDGGAKT